MKLGYEFLEETVDIIVLIDNVLLVDPRYRWRLITSDPDDDKFVDCAVACNADYIVTEDRHFREVTNTEFPRLTILSLLEFKELLANL